MTARRSGCAPRRGRRRGARSLLRAALAGEPLPPLPGRDLGRSGTVEPFLHTDWPTARSLGELGDGEGGRARDVRRGCATRVARRSRSRSRTSCRAAASGRGCSSGSPRTPRRSASRSSSRRCCRRTGRCSSVFADAGFGVDAPARRWRGRGAPRARRRPRRTATRVDERDHVAVAASVRAVLHARTVAVIGASRAARDDRRRALPQHPRRRLRRRRVPGEREANRSAASAVRVDRRHPGDVDLAVICVPGGAVLDAAAAALRQGRAALCVISAGFAEIGAGGRGAPGASCSRSCAPTARGSIGPNCLGIAVARRRT